MSRCFETYRPRPSTWKELLSHTALIVKRAQSKNLKLFWPHTEQGLKKVPFTAVVWDNYIFLLGKYVFIVTCPMDRAQTGLRQDVCQLHVTEKK